MEKYVVHKDLKPENFLLYNKDSKIIVKLIDFGMSEKLTFPNERLKIVAGSLPYLSPEMISHSGYDSKSDMFSLGVVLFNLLTGSQPFYGKNDDEIKIAILTSDPIFPKEIKNPNLIDILNKLLEKDPDKMLSAQEAKLHPWVQEYILLHQQQTVKKEFVPRISDSKYLGDLVRITNIKNIVWKNLLMYMNIEIAYKVRNLLLVEFSEDEERLKNQSIQGKFSINYDLFLEIIVKIAEDSNELKAKLESNSYF